VADEPAGRAAGLSATTLAEIERLAGLSFTDAERALALETAPGSLRIAERRQRFALENQDAPALGFRPAAPQLDRRFRASVSDRALPGDDESLAYASLADLSHWIASGALTSERLTALYLERLRRIGPDLECVVTLTDERALEEARAADRELARGERRGPLHGIPYGAKDLLDTAGIRTTWGAAPYRERVPDRDAFVVRRLREAGAVLAAKLTLGALANGDVWFGGKTRNPWQPTQGSSGSSAGSAAAVASGLVAFAVGSETLGSIVSPSLVCGTAGLRPTYGRVARTGAMALCWSLDKLGPMARRSEDTMLVLRAMQGADPGDPDSREVPLPFDAAEPLRGMRVGWCEAWFAEAVSSSAERAALVALRALDVELVPIELPPLLYEGILLEIQVETAAAFEELTRSGRDDELVEQGAHAWPNTFRTAWLVPAVEYVQLLRIRRQVMTAMDALFAEVDAVVAPSAGTQLNFATNWTGHPALALRTGFADDGTPGGVTLFGRLFREDVLVRLGTALEEVLGVWSLRPPVG
jgi:Asp-tRNA(Asn)/Glu-tRNA(Gln) amidotransferase A subunit family amidase